MNISISRQDTALLKGLAIIAIVLHNFAHWIPGAVVENEYNFYVSHSLDLLTVLSHGGPHIILNLFSYFGCYGVPVFLFISGYGMVRKYESGGTGSDAGVSVGRFALYNARKMWRLMIVGFALLLFYELRFTTGFHHTIGSVVWYFLFLSNFLPEGGCGILPAQDLLLGPWWYFSLTMQMYMLYRLLYYRRGKRPLIASAILSVVITLAAYYLMPGGDQPLLHYLRYTFLTTLLPFAMGVWTARYGLPKVRPLVSVTASVAVMALSLFFPLFWAIAPIAVVLLALQCLRLSAPLRRLPEYIGRISAFLFVVHPVVRCFCNPRLGGDVYPLLAEYLIAGFLAAAILYRLNQFIPKPRL